MTRRSSSGKSRSIAGLDSRRRRNPANEVQGTFRPQQPQDEDRFYVIEKLLQKRCNSGTGREEYLTRWQNYPPDYDSWEPKEELEVNASDMINEFERITKFSMDEDLHCICRRPYRFEQGGMIQCFRCSSWYHFSCLQMNMEQANSYAKYYCHECRQANPKLRNLIKREKSNTLHGVSLSDIC